MLLLLHKSLMKNSSALPWLLLSAIVVLVCSGSLAFAQSPPSTTRTNKYDLGVFAEYSPTSSHIFLGYSRQRELAGIGGSFAWRLLNRHSFEFAYLAEVRPLLMESDPTLVSINSNQYGALTFSPPAPVIDPGNLYVIYNSNLYSFNEGYNHARFSRRWTYTGGASPVGIKLNGFTHRRLQPEFMGNGGFLVATRDIPFPDTSYFNFTFEFGVGLQWYRTPTQSVQAEIRYHHLSNHDLGANNPGVDSALWKLTYTFGRSHVLR